MNQKIQRRRKGKTVSGGRVAASTRGDGAVVESSDDGEGTTTRYKVILT
ncbi:hypothetical protein [Clostridium sp. KNHs216]|nr:hypothetical protein [Clostridium sp. KNHs216]